MAKGADGKFSEVTSSTITPLAAIVIWFKPQLEILTRLKVPADPGKLVGSTVTDNLLTWYDLEVVLRLNSTSNLSVCLAAGDQEMEMLWVRLSHFPDTVVPSTGTVTMAVEVCENLNS
jgi:hypothetical protein